MSEKINFLIYSKKKYFLSGMCLLKIKFFMARTPSTILYNSSQPTNIPDQNKAHLFTSSFKEKDSN